MEVNVFDVGPLDVDPIYVHFTHVENLALILERGELGGPRPEEKIAGPSECEATYCYNVDIAERFGDFCTFPRKVLQNPDEHVALVFVGNSEVWWHYPEECYNAFVGGEDHPRAIQPLDDFFVVGLEEGLEFLGTSLEELCAQKGLAV